MSLKNLTLNENSVVGTVAHVVADDLPEAVRLLAGRPDWSDVAAEVIPLDQLIDRGLRPLRDGGAAQIKTLVDPWAETPRPAVHGR